MEGLHCFCEIQQLSGTDLFGCQQNAAPVPGASGWCYVDTDQGGNPDLVKLCAPDQKRTIRFEGGALPLPGAAVFIGCGG